MGGLNALWKLAGQGRRRAMALKTTASTILSKNAGLLTGYNLTPVPICNRIDNNAVHALSLAHDRLKQRFDPLNPLPTGPSLSTGLPGLGLSTPSAFPPWHQSTEESLTRYRFGFYHPVKLADTFKAGRYVVRRKLGWGGFSTVWLAFDRLHNQYVSLKIVLAGASSKKIDSTGKLSTSTPEVDILQKLQQHYQASHSTPDSSKGHPHVVQLIDYFQFDGPHGTHDCIVTEVLGQSLYTVLLQRERKLPTVTVKRIMRQLLSGLKLIHSVGAVHTDIKPDNLLLCVSNTHSLIEQAFAARRPEIVSEDIGSSFPRYISQPLSIIINDITQINVKLVDFGVANWANNPYMKTIQPRALRAPEVILGAKWDTSADIWSVGCLVPELLLGKKLFNPDEAALDETHLAQIIELLGDFPRDVISSGHKGSEFFNEKGDLIRVVPTNPTSIERVMCTLLSRSSEAPLATEIARLSSFVGSMLQIRPSDRATAAELLEHPWLRT